MPGDWFWLAYIICAAPPRCTGWCPPLRKKSAPPVLIYIYIYILIYTLCLVVKSHTKNEQHRKHRRKHYRKNTTKKHWELSLTTQKTTHPPPTPKRWRSFFDTWRVKFTNNCACVCPLHLLVIYHSCTIASIEPDICWSISVLMLALCSFSDFPIGWLSQIANPFFAWARDLKKIQGPEWYIGHLPKSTYTTWLSALTTLA